MLRLWTTRRNGILCKEGFETMYCTTWSPAGLKLRAYTVYWYATVTQGQLNHA
jgi:hypothetical protein